MLIDVFAADPKFGPRSRDTLRTCLVEGGLVASDVVWAEVTAGFPKATAAHDALVRLGIGFSALDAGAAEAAGATWRQYRARGGKRDRVIADFLVGAHAASVADRLLTRDRGFYRMYFGALTVLDPTARA